MANQNTVAGFTNLPAQIVTVNTAAVMIKVPAAGNYSRLPSPQLPVSSAVSIGVSDIAGNLQFDGFCFKIKVTAVVSNPGTGNFTCTLYQHTAANKGVIGAAGVITSTGVAGTGAVSLGALISGVALNTLAGGQIHSESLLLWDSSTGILGNLKTSTFWTLGTTTTAVADAAGTSINAGTDPANLNFALSFQFATANAANSVTVKEFVIERV